MNITAQAKMMQKCLLRSLICLCISGCMPIFAATQFDEAKTAAQVEIFLAKAKTALEEDRLTIPSGNNAVGYAQQVLDLVPNHPEAQQILRAVVARYGALGNASLDRAETLWMQEIQKAHKYHKRGARVAQEHHLSDDSLAVMEQRIANAQQPPSSMALTTTASGGSTQAVLLDVVERYLTLSEEASNKGALMEAEQHLNVSRDLITHYSLSSAESHRLIRRLMHMERLLAARKAAEAERFDSARTITKASPYAGKPVFIPPSF